MNKAYVLLLGALMALFFSSPVLGEDTVEWGALHTSAAGDYRSVIGEDDDNVYVYAVSMKRYYLEAYARGTFEKRYTTEIRPERVDDRKSEFQSFFYKNGKTYIFFSTFDRPTKTKRMYAYIVDNKTGQQVSEYAQILEVPVDKKRATIRFTVSKDESKILVRHITRYVFNRRQEVKFMLLNSDLTLLNYAEEESDLSWSNAYLRESPVLTDDGSMYFIKSDTSTRPAGLELLTYHGLKNWEKTTQIVRSDAVNDIGSTQYINGTRTTVNAKGEVVLVGYLSETVAVPGKKRPRVRFTGAVYLTLDRRTQKPKFTKVSRFDASFMAQFQSEQDIKVGREAVAPNQFHSINLLKKSDGGIVLIGELYWYRRREVNTGNGIQTVGEKFFYGDLIVLNFSPNGDLLWANRVPKKQVYWWSRLFAGIIVTSKGPGFLYVNPQRTVQYFSYQSVLKENELVVLFNDNPRNNESAEDSASVKPFTTPAKATMTRFVMDLQSGEKREEMFPAGEDSEVLFKPLSDSRGVEADTVYLLGVKGRKYKFGTYASSD